MSDLVVLKGGVLGEDGSIYLLCEDEESEDDEVFAVVGRRSGDQFRLTRLTDLEEFVSMVALTPPFSDRFGAACLTFDGFVHFLSAEGGIQEVIPGTGWERTGSLGLGRMTTLKQIGNTLFAFGYGGQVYARASQGDWRPMHVPPDLAGPDIAPCFYAVIQGPHSNSLVFAGTDIASTANTDEINAANEADDADLLADLLLDASRPDLMGLWAYDGSWQRLGLDLPGSINEIISLKKNRWLLFSDIGVIWETLDFQSFSELLVTAERSSFKDIKIVMEQPTVLLGSGLFVLNGGELAEFVPIMPGRAANCLNISASHDALLAVFENHVLLLSNDRWERMEPVFNS